jgi:hypothetical protein
MLLFTRLAKWLRLPALVALAACSTVGTGTRPDEKELVIRGVVTSIVPLQTLLAAWEITVAVEGVDKGTYVQQQFTFSVHSPAMSGLTVGEHYMIVAIESKTGYTIDDSQWVERGEAKWPQNP